ncbi:unnamed protein product [Echinostoma caproni]|uniref:Mab-21 domain-containing protein n=1 Tax=Echinostoma caproni TaxID=27848 RepID=A0A183AH88_9TREM|nr:unnamed protein product [Echinostoma caproni]
MCNESVSWNTGRLNICQLPDAIDWAYQNASASVIIELSRSVHTYLPGGMHGIRPIVLMVWPQLLPSVIRDPSTTILKLQNGADNSQFELTNNGDRVKYQPHVALLIELLFGNKTLPFDFWSRDPNLSGPVLCQNGWPVPQWNAERYRRHSMDWQQFPNCLDALLLGSLHANSLSEASYTWQVLVQIWATHTMSKVDEIEIPTSTETIVYIPPSLRRLARWAVRRAIVHANFGEFLIDELVRRNRIHQFYMDEDSDSNRDQSDRDFKPSPMSYTADRYHLVQMV